MKYVLAFKGVQASIDVPGADIRKFLKLQAVLPASRGWPVPSILARAMHWRMAVQDRSRRLSNLFCAHIGDCRIRYIRL